MAKVFKMFLTSLFTSWSEDVLVLAGLGVLLYTTYSWSVVVGNYALGFILLLLGLFMSKR